MFGEGQEDSHALLSTHRAEELRTPLQRPTATTAAYLAGIHYGGTSRDGGVPTEGREDSTTTDLEDSNGTYGQRLTWWELCIPWLEEDHPLPPIEAAALLVEWGHRGEIPLACVTADEIAGRRRYDDTDGNSILSLESVSSSEAIMVAKTLTMRVRLCYAVRCRLQNLYRLAAVLLLVVHLFERPSWTYGLSDTSNQLSWMTKIVNATYSCFQSKISSSVMFSRLLTSTGGSFDEFWQKITLPEQLLETAPHRRLNTELTEEDWDNGAAYPSFTMPYLPPLLAFLITITCLLILSHAAITESTYRKATATPSLTKPLRVIIICTAVFALFPLFGAATNSPVPSLAPLLSPTLLLLIERRWQPHTRFLFGLAPKLLGLAAVMATFLGAYTILGLQVFPPSSAEAQKYFHSTAPLSVDTSPISSIWETENENNRRLDESSTKTYRGGPWVDGMWTLLMVLSSSNWPIPMMPATSAHRPAALYFVFLIAVGNWGLLNATLGAIYTFRQTDSEALRRISTIIARRCLLTAFALLECDVNSTEVETPTNHTSVLSFGVLQAVSDEIFFRYFPTKRPLTTAELFAFIAALGSRNSFVPHSGGHQEWMTEGNYSSTHPLGGGLTRTQFLRFHRIYAAASTREDRRQSRFLVHLIHRSSQAVVQFATPKPPSPNATTASIVITGSATNDQNRDRAYNGSNFSVHGTNPVLSPLQGGTNHLQKDYDDYPMFSSPTQRSRSWKLCQKVPIPKSLVDCTVLFLTATDTPWFDGFMDVLLGILGTSYLSSSGASNDAQISLLVTFTSISLIEMLLRLISRGSYRCRHSQRIQFDSMITILLVVVSSWEGLHGRGNRRNENFLIQFAILLRTLAIPRAIFSLPVAANFRQRHATALRAAAKAAAHVFFLLLTLFAALYITAALGLLVFGGAITKVGPRAPAIYASSYGMLGYWPENFNDLPSAISTLLLLLHVNNTHVTSSGFEAADIGPVAAVRAFFALWYALGVLCLLNILVATIVTQVGSYLSALEEDATARAAAADEDEQAKLIAAAMVTAVEPNIVQTPGIVQINTSSVSNTQSRTQSMSVFGVPTIDRDRWLEMLARTRTNGLENSYRSRFSSYGGQISYSSNKGDSFSNANVELLDAEHTSTSIVHENLGSSLPRISSRRGSVIDAPLFVDDSNIDISQREYNVLINMSRYDVDKVVPPTSLLEWMYVADEISPVERAAAMVQFARDGREHTIRTTRRGLNCYRLRSYLAPLFRAVSYLYAFLRLFERPLWTYRQQPNSGTRQTTTYFQVSSASHISGKPWVSHAIFGELQPHSITVSIDATGETSDLWLEHQEFSIVPLSEAFVTANSSISKDYVPFSVSRSEDFPRRLEAIPGTEPYWGDHKIFPRSGVPLMSTRAMAGTSLVLLVILFIGLLLELGYKESVPIPILYTAHPNGHSSSQTASSSTVFAGNGRRVSKWNCFSCRWTSRISTSHILRLALCVHCVVIMICLIISLILTSNDSPHTGATPSASGTAPHESVAAILVPLSAMGSILYLTWFNRRSLEKIKIVAKILPKLGIGVACFFTAVSIFAFFGPSIFGLSAADDASGGAASGIPQLQYGDFTSSFWTTFSAVTSSSFPNQVMPAIRRGRYAIFYTAMLVIVCATGGLNAVLVAVLVEFHSAAAVATNEAMANRQALLVRAFSVLDTAGRGWLSRETIYALIDELYAHYSDFQRDGLLPPTPSAAADSLRELLGWGPPAVPEWRERSPSSAATHDPSTPQRSNSRIVRTLSRIPSYVTNGLIKTDLMNQEDLDAAVAAEMHRQAVVSMLVDILDVDGDGRVSLNDWMFILDVLRLRFKTKKNGAIAGYFERNYPTAATASWYRLLRLSILQHRFSLVIDLLGLILQITMIAINYDNLYNVTPSTLIFTGATLSLYLAELLISIFVKGLRGAMKTFRCRFEASSLLVIITANLLQLIIHGTLYTVTMATIITRILILLRLLTVPRHLRLLLKNQQRPAFLLTKILRRIFARIYTLGTVFLCVAYAFAALATFLFGGIIRKDGGGHAGDEEFLGSLYIYNGYWPLSANDFCSAILTLFSALHVSDFDIVATGFRAASGNSILARLFFTAWYVIGVLLLLNIVKAFFMEEILHLVRAAAAAKDTNTSTGELVIPPGAVVSAEMDPEDLGTSESRTSTKRSSLGGAGIASRKVDNVTGGSEPLIDSEDEAAEEDAEEAARYEAIVSASLKTGISISNLERRGDDFDRQSLIGGLDISTLQEPVVRSKIHRLASSTAPLNSLTSRSAFANTSSVIYQTPISSTLQEDAPLSNSESTSEVIADNSPKLGLQQLESSEPVDLIKSMVASTSNLKYLDADGRAALLHRMHQLSLDVHVGVIQEDLHSGNVTRDEDGDETDHFEE